MEALATRSPPAAPPATGPATAVKVALTFQGVGPLHMGFFNEAQALGDLGLDLGPHLRDTAQVLIYYDSKEFQGTIHLKVPPGLLVAPVPVEGERVDLGALAPLTTALAAYRSAIASRYDVRVQNFAVGLDFFRGSTHCLVQPTGPLPHDGALVSPCVRVGAEELCGTPEPGGVRFGREALATLRSCLN